MKLSEADHENIEVLEALDLDEYAFFLLLVRYFTYRGRGARIRVNLTADQALQKTIRVSVRMKERGTL